MLGGRTLVVLLKRVMRSIAVGRWGGGGDMIQFKEQSDWRLAEGR